MTKWIETTGRSEEDAIAAALFQLGLDRDDVSVEVLERAKPGFLGFGGNPARVRVRYEMPGEPEEAPRSAPAEEKRTPERAPAVKPAPPPEQKREKPPTHVEKKEPERRAEHKAFAPPPSPEVSHAAEEQPTPAAPLSGQDDAVAARITEFLTGLMAHLGVDARPEVRDNPEGGYQVVLLGQGLGAVIGRRGETLDAIQQLTSYAVNRGLTKRVRIHIDAEHYRAKREEALRRLAVKVAGKVVKYRKSVTLEAMNAYERHIIHATLQEYKGVSTYSTGVEPNRRTVVSYDPARR